MPVRAARRRARPGDPDGRVASGGRRRSEVAHLRLEQLRDEPPVSVNAADPASSPLPCLAIQLGRTKTTSANDDGRVLMVGPPVIALKRWIKRARIAKGPIFRAINRWGTVEDRSLSPQSVNLILKRRCAAAGLNPDDYSAHGLRSGYLTEAARQGVSLPEAMQQSQHRSVQQAASYYNDADRTRGRRRGSRYRAAATNRLSGCQTGGCETEAPGSMTPTGNSGGIRGAVRANRVRIGCTRTTLTDLHSFGDRPAIYYRKPEGDYFNPES